jgi:hypothetical protein
MHRNESVYPFVLSYSYNRSQPKSLTKALMVHLAAARRPAKAPDDLCRSIRVVADSLHQPSSFILSMIDLLPLSLSTFEAVRWR